MGGKIEILRHEVSAILSQGVNPCLFRTALANLLTLVRGVIVGIADGRTRAAIIYFRS